MECEMFRLRWIRRRRSNLYYEIPHEALVAVVVFQVTEYGAVVSSAPRAIPSRRNWTPVTPVLSEAVAESVMVVPETVEPVVGVEREMVGAVVSGVGVV